MTTDSLKAKIQKLLEMTTERGATEAEAAVAFEKAQQLLAAHNLTEVEVRGASKNHNERGDFLAFAWAKKIAEAVAQLYDCRYQIYKSDKKNHFRTSFIGRQGNAETAKLITEFAVKMVLKLSRDAQKKVHGDSRYATDFAHGCATRVCETAFTLWREANKELIEERERKDAAEAESRKALELIPRNLPPGAYTVEWLTSTWRTKKEFLGLTADETMALYRKTQKEKPTHVHVITIECTAGDKKGGHGSWWVREPAYKAGRQLVQNSKVFNEGKEAGANIGLRIQMGGSNAKGSLE